MAQDWENLSEQIRGFLYDEYPEAAKSTYDFFISGVESRFVKELLDTHGGVIEEMFYSYYLKDKKKWEARTQKMKDETQNV